MFCDSLEHRRVSLDNKVVCQNTIGERPYMSDSELAEQLLRLEIEMEKSARPVSRYAVAR